jgi:fumarate hydratase class II
MPSSGPLERLGEAELPDRSSAMPTATNPASKAAIASIE